MGILLLGSASVISVNLVMVGDSEVVPAAYNNFNTYFEQSAGLFSRPITSSLNYSEGATSAESWDVRKNEIAGLSEATALNVLVLPLGINDIALEGNTAAQTYAFLLSIADRWYTEGAGHKVVLVEMPHCNWTNAGMVTQAENLNILLQAGLGFDFDGLVLISEIPEFFTANGTDPASETYVVGTHTTEAGNTLVVPEYIAAVNSVI